MLWKDQKIKNMKTLSTEQKQELKKCTQNHHWHLTTGSQEKQGSRRDRKAQPGGTDLQGVSEACLLVLDAAHEQETEGFLCDCMPFMNNFLGEKMRRSC